jgi:N-acetylglucosaminyldiphosphoundecaprenol N-acetyl-beta-D-mannosaminyltransferase
MVRRPLTTADSPPASRPSDRAALLGCEIDRLDMSAMVAQVDAIIARGGFARHASVNAAKVVAMRQDPQLRRIVSDCELVSADGQPVVWAASLLGDPLPGRVAGIDLMQELIALAERRGYRVFVLGARADVLAEALRRIRARHPRLAIAGARDGYFSDDDSAAVAGEIAAHRPDMVFIALPSPRKEYWLSHHGRRLGAPFVMGVGGAVDVLAGRVRRAPTVLQRLGLEWLFRLLQEPRRLLSRYLATNTRFVLLLLTEVGRQRARALRRWTFQRSRAVTHRIRR